MQIHVTDTQKFNENINVKLPCTIHSLLELISKQFNFDTSLCSVYQAGKELEFGFQLTPQSLENDNTLVLFNQKFYKEQFFINVDNPVHLPATKFDDYFTSVNVQDQKLNRNSKSTSDKNSQLEDNYYTFLQSRISPQYISISPQESSDNTDNNNNETVDQDQKNAETIESTANLNESEREAVERLCTLGYDRLTVIQIFIICDRNEEEALNLLRSMQ